MPEKQVLFENFLSLSVLQIASYLLPLIIYSYLMSVLGVNLFGLVFFVFAFVQYFTIFCDYGFDLSATREIALKRHNLKSLSNIFSSVLVLKLLLILFSFIVFFLLVEFIPKFNNDKLIFYSSFGIVIGSSIFPVWFFQGMERMKSIAVLKVFSQIIILVLMFVFVKKADDYLYIPILNSLGFLLSGFLGIYYAVKKFGVKLYIPKFRSIKKQFNYSSEFFLSKAALSVCTNTNTFCLGLVATNSLVGLYVAAERIYLTVKGLQTPLHNVLYPYVSKHQDSCLFCKVFKWGMILNIIISVFMYVNAYQIIDLFYGIELLNSGNILKIFSIIQLITFPSIMLGYPLLGAFGYTKIVNNSIIFSLPFHLLCLFSLYITSNLNIYTVCYATLITEFLILIIRVFYVLKHKLFTKVNCKSLK